MSGQPAVSTRLHNLHAYDQQTFAFAEEGMNQVLNIAQAQCSVRSTFADPLSVNTHVWRPQPD